MKYLAFDIEIAFDFTHINTDLFPPEDGERVLLVKDVINEDNETEETRLEAQYVGNIIKRFRLPDGELVKSAYWEYQGNDWKRFRPLGITCAAAASSDGGLWNWWAHDDLGKFTDKMDQVQCWSLVQTLNNLIHQGYTLLSWNGLGFDFDVLREESADDMNFCRDLALSHIDMMFHFFASKGYPLGLDAAAKGMGLPGKPEGMDGAKAPQLWLTDPYRVLSYCSLDVKNTLAVAEAVDDSGGITWTARSGRLNNWQLGSQWLTAKEAMALPEPNTSWMSDPWPRSKFYGWTGAGWVASSEQSHLSPTSDKYPKKDIPVAQPGDYGDESDDEDV